MGIPLKNINNKGFTLLELMVALAISAILATLAVPSFTGSIRSNRLTTTNNEFLASLNFARSEAIKRGMSVTVRKVDNNSFSNLGAGANWENGWDVFTDADGDGNFEAGDIPIKTNQSVPTNFTLRGMAPGFINRITYQPNGIARSDRLPNGVINNDDRFVLCDNFDGDNVPQANTSKMIIVGPTGRAMTAGDADNDGIPNTNAGAEIISCTSATFI